ncbi:hypothetical protein [Salicibibacter kimchii]|uniref:Uncharacterized protein n=1 Tax=Salicibibacter kimchii TaxID=2099786 RepID=A0A345BV22_9BACI|nr:hypothetical protein [Salicibibacter kimchii]AXF54803.1 hypothetical protein DT065_01405 [Salicibibacter kimchii]
MSEIYNELKTQLAEAKEAKNVAEVVRLSNDLKQLTPPDPADQSTDDLKAELQAAYDAKNFSEVVRLDNDIKSRAARDENAQ